MAHELHIVNGIASMAFIGETPWHGLGQQLTPDSTMEEWRQAANMQFSIERSAVQYKTPVIVQDPLSNGISHFPEKHVLYRSDTYTPLAVVSDKYKIVQPAEVLDFYQELTKSLGYQMATAGVLFGGKRYWALASAGETARIGTDTVTNPQTGIQSRGDEYGRYLLFSTACDGTMATRIVETTVRVVCNNTLQVANHSTKGAGISIPHSREFSAKQVKDDLGLGDSFTHFMEDMRQFSDRTLTKTEATNYLIQLMGNPDLKPEEQTNGRTLQEVYELYDNKSMGNQLQSSHGTLLGMLNAVTEYTDHHTAHRTTDARVNSAWFGASNTLKSRAFTQAQTLLAVA